MTAPMSDVKPIKPEPIGKSDKPLIESATLQVACGLILLIKSSSHVIRLSVVRICKAVLSNNVYFHSQKNWWARALPPPASHIPHPTPLIQLRHPACISGVRALGECDNCQNGCVMFALYFEAAAAAARAELLLLVCLSWERAQEQNQ